MDGAGEVYLTGSADFPFGTRVGEGSTVKYGDALVVKLGGSYPDAAAAVAVDRYGDAWVTGWTGSSDFPTANALQGVFGGGYADAFVAKIAAVPRDRYRLYSPVTKEHHYTTDLNEYTVLATRGWIQEGVAGHVVP